MSRTLDRSIARNLYSKFAKRWNQEKKLAGVYGKPGYKKPKFNEWYAMHQKNLEMMKESAPSDVVEYLGDDPWGGAKEYTAQQINDGQDQPKEERGVVTIDIASGKEDE